MPVSKSPRKKKRMQTRKHEHIGSFAMVSDEHGEASFSIDENGGISSPQGVEGTYTLRTSYARQSGKEKVVFEHNAGKDGMYLTERAQLCANFEKLAAIDTNVATINGEDIFISVFAISKGLLSQADANVEFETHAFYFFGVPEGVDKEMVGLDIALHNMIRPELEKKPCRLGFVTDSNLGAHEKINSRALPFLGEKLLDPNVKLIYGSSDTGIQLTNDIMRKCDSIARKIAKYLVENPADIEQTGANYKYCRDLARFDLSKVEHHRP
jgi:hypothetical protein